jgi:Hyaluronidase protein (HylP)
MSRLPVVGSDDDIWGDLLNDFLAVEHAKDGTLKIRMDGTLYTKPAGGIPKTDLDAGAQAALGRADTAVQSVNGKSGPGVNISASDIGAVSTDALNTFTKRLTINEPGAGAGTLLLPDTSASTGITFGGDTNLFRSGNGQLQTSSAFFAVRATLGVAAIAATQSGDATRRFQVNTDGKVLWSAGSGAQDTSLVRETGGGLKVSSTAGTLSSPATPTLTLAPAGVTSGSPSTGGTLFINQGTNPGSAFNTFTNAGSGALGRLMNVAVLNPTFDQAAFHIDYVGTANGMEMVSTSAASTSNALSITSTNPNSTAAGVNGTEIGKGTVKIVHTYPGTNDANASALSLRANGAGTAAQGIFFDAEDGGTTGNLMKMRNAGVDKFIMGSNGGLYSAYNVQVGATVPDVGGGAGVIGIKEAVTVPTANPAAGGVIMYAEQGQLKWRDPSGNVFTATGGSVSVNSPNPQPEDQAYKGWAFDPAIAANFTQPISGQPVLIKVKASVSGSINTANIYVGSTVGSGFTANASFAALYSLAGTPLAVSNDLAGTLNTSGAKAIPFTSSVSVAANTFYYVWLVVNASTMPQLARGANIGSVNQGLNPGNYRFCTLGGGVASPPASLSLGGSAPLSVSYWTALS